MSENPPDHDHGTADAGGDVLRPESLDADAIVAHEDRMLSRPSPVGQSSSHLASRDYQPRTGGPELVTQWPLGPAPGQDGLGAPDWEVDVENYAVVQKNIFTVPYLPGLECSKLHLSVCGRGYSDGGALSVLLENEHLDGKPYETELSFDRDAPEYFHSPMVEFASDRREDYPHNYSGRGDVYGGYRLLAKVESGTGYLDQGTCVQLWSES